MEKFTPVNEAAITRSIISEFSNEFNEFAESDCIIAGGGPAGLVAARNIARAGKKVVLLERNNYLGGSAWSGGFFMSKITVRHPGEKLLDEIGIPYKVIQEGLAVYDAVHMCSALIAAACFAGARIYNNIIMEDLILIDDRVGGAVINRTPVASLPQQNAISCPVSLEAPFVIDATGHEASVAKKLEQRGLVKVKGEGLLWTNKSEDLVVEHTGECYPGLIIAGMAVATVSGVPYMGPTFGSLFLSGEAAAKIVLDKLK